MYIADNNIYYDKDFWNGKMNNNYRIQEINCCNNCGNKVQKWEWIECSLTYDKEEDFAETVSQFGICDKYEKDNSESIDENDMVNRLNNMFRVNNNVRY